MKKKETKVIWRIEYKKGEDKYRWFDEDVNPGPGWKATGKRYKVRVQR